MSSGIWCSLLLKIVTLTSDLYSYEGIWDRYPEVLIYVERFITFYHLPPPFHMKMVK